MAMQIPADIETRIQQKVAEGFFSEADEVIREAMRLLDQQERQLEAFRAKLQIGLDQLDRGEYAVFTPELVEEMRREADERFRRGARPKPDVVP